MSVFLRKFWRVFTGKTAVNSYAQLRYLGITETALYLWAYWLKLSLVASR